MPSEVETAIQPPVQPDSQRKSLSVSTANLKPEHSTFEQELIAQNPEWSEVLDDFTALKILGQGAFGQVVKVQNKKSQNLYAIKYIPDAFKCFYTAKKVFREISILYKLTSMKCPTVTHLYDVIIPSGDIQKCEGIFMVQEYVERSLNNLFRSKRKMVYDEALMTKIVYQLLSALAFMSSAGIMHRDLKPENILLTKDFDVKICDFGLARPVAEDPDCSIMPSSSKKATCEYLHKNREKRRMARRKVSNHVVSRWYRPPEVILFEKNYNPSLDLWSMGCIISELVSQTDKYREHGVKACDRFLFPGKACFPLSPSENNSDPDQIELILSLLGGLTEDDMSFITEVEQFDYVFQRIVPEDPVRFDLEFELTNKGICKVLEGLLKFNPFLRKPAKDLAALSVFDEVRSSSMETRATEKITLSVDSEGAFDYDKSLTSDSYFLYDIRNMIEVEIMKRR